MYVALEVSLHIVPLEEDISQAYRLPSKRPSSSYIRGTLYTSGKASAYGAPKSAIY